MSAYTGCSGISTLKRLLQVSHPSEGHEGWNNVQGLEPSGSQKLCAYWSTWRVALDAHVVVEHTGFEPVISRNANAALYQLS